MFCNVYGLPTDACRLFFQGVELANQSIGQVRPPVASSPAAPSATSCMWGNTLLLTSCWQMLTDFGALQLNRMPKTLQLTATFEHSLALCIWQSFGAGKQQVKAEFWESTLDLLAEEANWEALHFGIPQDLTNLVSLPARVGVPEDFACTANKTPNPDWSAVHMSARPLLLLMRTYLQSACVPNGLGPAACVSQNIDALEDHLIKSPDFFITMFSAKPPSCHLRKLRAAFLLIKLLSVLTTFKVVGNHLQKEVTQMLSAFGTMALALQQEADIKSVHNAEVTEAQQLSLHIVRLAVPVMKHVGKRNATGSFGCCLMLQHLMVSNKPAVYQAVATELIRAGHSLSICLQAGVTMHSLLLSGHRHVVHHVELCMAVCLGLAFVGSQVLLTAPTETCVQLASTGIT